MTDMVEYETVQAPRYTDGSAHSATEIARIIAKHSKWLLHDDELVNVDRKRIAAHLTEACRAMEALGWVGGDEQWRYVNWGAMPTDSAERANLVRDWLKQA